MVLELGGEPERKRYEKLETLQRTHSQGDVLHHWQVGDILGVSFKEHDEETIRVYSIGLQRAPQTLRLSVRLAALYKQAQIQEMLKTAAAGGHELNWAHFRQLLREGITDAQRVTLVARIVRDRLGYRELQDVITGILGGKKSQGGRKPGKTKYKTYVGALSAMKLRSRAWLAQEDGWIDQFKGLVSNLSDDEKHTPEFLQLTHEAAIQLRDVANKAQRDAEEAEAIAAEVSTAMGNPELTEDAEETEEEAPAKVSANGNGMHKGKLRKAGMAKPKPRVRLAKHPKAVNGQVMKR
jgi:hypothetical protein